MNPLEEIYAHPVLFKVVFLFLFLPPAGKILWRTGHNPLWCVLALFPGLNLGAFWFLAVQVMAHGQQAHELATRKLKRKKVHISRYSLATNHFLTSDAIGCIRSLEKIVQVKLVVS